MENRALLAFALSVAILVGYSLLFESPQPPSSMAVTAPEGVVAPAETSPPAAPSKPEPVAESQTRPDVTHDAAATANVRTDLYEATLTAAGGRIQRFELTRYRARLEDDSPPLDMVAAADTLPLGVSWRGPDGAERDDEGMVYDLSVREVALSGSQTESLTLRGTAAGGERVVKTLTFRGDAYVIDYSVSVSGRSAGPLAVSWARRIDPNASTYALEGPAGYVDAELQTVAAAGLEEPQEFRGVVSWAGYADHYFLAAYYPVERRPLRMTAAKVDASARVTLWDDAAGEATSWQLYVGPKVLHDLAELGHDLDGAVDLGMFTIVARPLLEMLLFLQKFIGNFGWAIIVLTIGIRLVLYPINRRQIEAMKAMQRLQPEIKKIQEKYKSDRERLNKEMMELYRRHRVNPLSGCLPMVLQLPVFIGLYNVLMQAIELRHAPFMAWINDLSQPDRLGQIPIPFVDPAGIPVMTLLMGASMLVQQKMTPSAGDPAQQRMMMIMPLVFTVMFVNFPSGLVLYWLSNNVLSIGQQYLSDRRTV